MAPLIKTVHGLQEANICAILTKIQNAYMNGIFNAGGLQIKTGGSALAKTVNTIKGVVNGVHFKRAAADMAALTGINIADTKFGLVELRCAVDGTLTAAALTVTATSYLNALESLPTSRVTTYAVVGYLVIQNAQGGGTAFTGGTTALDASGITTDYIDTVIPCVNEFLTLPS